MKIKDMSREVLSECRRIRPNEFAHVSDKQVERVLLILYRNISFIIKTCGLLVIKDYLILRPDTSALVKSQFYAERKRRFADLKRLRFLAGERAAHRLYEKAGNDPRTWGKVSDSVDGKC